MSEKCIERWMSATRLAISPNRKDVPHISCVISLGATRFSSSSQPPAISRLKPNTTSPFCTNTRWLCPSRQKRRCLNSHRLRYKLESENKPQSAKSTSSSGYNPLIDYRKSGRSTNIQMISYRKKNIIEQTSHSRKDFLDLCIIT